ncbi:hypothetical protein [Rouxiella badensis]|uniref:Phage tail protein n=1 Tax=Rouxiella badensis TaxID=1646377 RepID=A0A1X0WB26_9GAMM|nr:hypothetical protein [Rouxiella badensis]ORJ23969.1 hypothetical protein BS640_18890 [Rouxiella badensis]
MEKISSYTTTADANNEFTNGSVASGVSPTNLVAGWFNMIQRELVAVATAANITLDSSNDAQLLAALQALFITREGGDLTGQLTVQNLLAAIKSAPGALGGVLEAINESSDADSSAAFNFGFGSAVMASASSAIADDGSTNITFSVSPPGTVSDRRTAGLEVIGETQQTNSVFDLYENGQRVYSPNNIPSPATVGALALTGGNLSGNVSSSAQFSSSNGTVGFIATGLTQPSSTTYNLTGYRLAANTTQYADLYWYNGDGGSRFGVHVQDPTANSYFEFFYTGVFKAPGNIYSGEACYQNDGNIYGTAWGGYISDYLAAMKTATAAAYSSTNLPLFAAGEVGSYAFAGTNQNVALSFGDTVAGSSLYAASVHAAWNASDDVASIYSSAVLTGTWRCLGYFAANSNTSFGHVTLFQRIA